jgi:glucose-6-phosphate isomerase
MGCIKSVILFCLKLVINMIKITELPEWNALHNHQKHIAPQHMQDWFSDDPLRFSRFSLAQGEILFDYSKNRITPETMSLLCDLAKAAGLSQKIEGLFTGDLVNTSENRPALHTALRDRAQTPLHIHGQDIRQAIKVSLDTIEVFVNAVREGKWLGASQKPIRDIVNIGIGGSHLGPLLTVHALGAYAHPDLRCHFISNIDSAHLHEVLTHINPETTLFIISSKSFTTLETITNAQTVKIWLQQKIPGAAIHQHFVAITAAFDKALQFGIPATQIFPVWEWVGGRYSIWSAIGLPLALMIGIDNFLEFLDGAHAMDQHFRHSEFSENMPVLMALLGIWYINFFGANNHAIVPYSHHLNHLRTYLQQADMESNGKNISTTGISLDYATGPIIWGEQGCNAQHAFHQLLHQGQHFIPVDFILVSQNDDDFALHQDILISSGLSQSQALMRGKSYQQALEELKSSEFSPADAEILARHKSIPGNRPSNTLLLHKITPRSLGSLLALYEHKIFVQGAIWNINSFDQWGVELGKQLLPQILADLKNPDKGKPLDSSTAGLIQHYKKLRSQA